MHGVHVESKSSWVAQRRIVRCERCGFDFALLARTREAVSAAGLLVAFESDRHMEARLARKCDERILDLQTDPFGKARCPGCHGWQRWMVTLARPTGFFAGFCAGLLVAIVPILIVLTRVRIEPDAIARLIFPWMGACGAVGAALGATFPLAFEFWNRRHDPRAMTLPEYLALTDEALRVGVNPTIHWARRLGWRVDHALFEMDTRPPGAKPIREERESATPGPAD